jgi:diguanylate cyclase (GGDEF)-like protein
MKKKIFALLALATMTMTASAYDLTKGEGAEAHGSLTFKVGTNENATPANEGDVVIKGIADTISNEIRKDIDIVARFGGEEFVVALIDTDSEGMIETAERIRKSVQKLAFDIHQADPLRVTVSIGAFLMVPGFNGELQKAVNNADQALYRAKEGGRNQVVQFQEVEAEPATV